MRCMWLVCEAENRWRRAVAHFGPQMLPAQECVLVLRSVASPEACRVAAADQSSAVVLWELPAGDASETLAAIDRTARHPGRLLQLVALPPQAALPRQMRVDIELTLRELGVASLLDQPVALAQQRLLVHRYWQQNQRDDNLSTVREIWDRLPWASNL